MDRPARRRSRLTSVSVAAALLPGACGADGNEIAADATTSTTGRETTTTASAQTTSTAAPTPEEEVLAAYQAYWAAVDEMFAPPPVRPELPAFRQHATGEVLVNIVRSAEETRAEGSVFQVPEAAHYSHRALE